MLQILLLCVLGTGKAVPTPVSNFLGYNLPYFYNFNQPNPLAAASLSNPPNLGFSFPPFQAPTSFPQIYPHTHVNNGASSFPPFLAPANFAQINPLAHLNNGASSFPPFPAPANFAQINPLAHLNNGASSFPPFPAPANFAQINPLAHLNNVASSFPQAGFSGSVIQPFSPVRQNIQSLQSPLSHSFASSHPHVASQPHPLAASFPQLSQPVHNSVSGFHGHSNPNHYSTSQTLNPYEPKAEFQRINLPPIVRENKLEIRQPVLNTVRYVQPTLYKINRHRVDVTDDKYDFDGDDHDDYKRGYHPLQPQPTVLTYSVRSPSRDYIQEHTPLSYAIRSHPTLFKRSHSANYQNDHEFENEESVEAKFKSGGKQEEASGEEEGAADEEE